MAACLLMVVMGLIPAYAGSTACRARGRPQPRAHPRLRGEHAAAVDIARHANGSSPLTRGAHHIVTLDMAKERLIPAYAGSTMVWRAFSVMWGAHPRLRGEHSGLLPPDSPPLGSSPLTRGGHLLTCTFPSLKSILDPT